MNCGTATATPRVLSNRITNGGGFLARFRHQPRANAPIIDGVSDDEPTTRVVTTTTVTTTTSSPTPTSSDPTPTSQPTPTDTPTPSASVSKYDRLSDLGITEENYSSQSDSFRNQVNEYRREVGNNGDWSGFNPSE